METLPQMWVRQSIQENLCEDLMDSIKLEGMEEESDDAGDDVDDPSDPAESSDEEATSMYQVNLKNLSIYIVIYAQQLRYLEVLVVNFV